MPSIPIVSPELARQLAATAPGLVDTLPSQNRNRALMHFDAAERRDWHYVPRRRPGLPLRGTSRGPAGSIPGSRTDLGLSFGDALKDHYEHGHVRK